MNGYFDWNATTPLHPAAREAWLQAAWENPSSLYRSAAAARQQLEDCRERAAHLLNCPAEEIVFLSGATEANNAVLQYVKHAGGARVAVSGIEHPCVREPAGAIFGTHCLTIPAAASGVCEADFLQPLLHGPQRPALVALMAANNETGVLQPWREVLSLCRAAGVPFHCDAAQWIGKLPCDGLGECDFLTGSAHKFGGPKGIGFLKASGTFRGQRGGAQENRHRAGTENLPAVAAMLAAWEAIEPRLANAGAWKAARDEFEAALAGAVPGLEIIAREVPRLWNTVMLVLPEGVNTKWLARLDRRGFCVSTGSACSSGGGASEVLTAMGLNPDKLRRVLRVSAGWDTTPADWRALAGAFGEVFAELRGQP